ncbi:hypothetical protein EG329_005075 [Mollisiaceae sp. DMI_Dod_QoI]|nr:hypothetical protein EG329_005075 [Helotiales sp. DMI_Dod_QoI]
MPDPLSIIGVLAVAMDGIERARKFTEAISGAPQAIAKLDNELKAISQLLRQVYSFVHQIHAADSSAQDSFIPHLQTALANCSNVASEVETLLRPYVKSTRDPKRSTWRRIAWTFKEQKTTGLEKDMATCKQTLNMAISFADLAVSSQSSRRVIKIERGVKQIQMNLGIDNVSVVDSDYAGSVDTAYRRNIMTSQWIMQTDTINEETTVEVQEEEYHETSHEDDGYFDALDREAPIKSSFPVLNTIETSRERSERSSGWAKWFNTTPTQPPVMQEKAGPASKIFQWKPAQTRPPVPPPPPARPTNFEDGQLIRKTKVSRAALESMRMRFSEEGNYVRLPERIDARTLQILRNKSLELCKNSNLWWTDPPSRPAVVSRDQKIPIPQVVSLSSVVPPSNRQNDGDQQGQTLRKTIVSRAALQHIGIYYSEDRDHVFLPQKLDAATVRNLRELSARLSGNPREWWT